MKIIVSTLAGTLGPFVEVTEQADHIKADGAIYPFSVIGSATVEEQGDWQPPAPPVTEAQAVDAVQARLDAFAKTRGYDGILSACSYAVSTVPKFSTEGTRAVSLRDETWAACYEILADVQAGNRPVPTLDELLAELPELTWPA